MLNHSLIVPLLDAMMLAATRISHSSPAVITVDDVVASTAGIILSASSLSINTHDSILKASSSALATHAGLTSGPGRAHAAAEATRRIRATAQFQALQASHSQVHAASTMA